MSEPFEKVARINELASGECRIVQAAGRDIALCNVEGRMYALDNVCPHQGGPLGEGMLEGESLACPWHGWTFNVKDGSCLFNPRVRVKTLKVKIEGQDVLITGS